MALTGEAAEAVKAKITETTKERDAFLVTVNKELAWFAGKIAGYEALLEESNTEAKTEPKTERKTEPQPVESPNGKEPVAAK